MKHYVQLKDGVVFAHIDTPNEIPTSDTIIEVDENGEPLLNHIPNDGNFQEAEKIKYVIVDPADNNVVINVKQTYFSSEMEKDNGIYVPIESNITTGWFWNGLHGTDKKFTAPENMGIENSQPIVVEQSPGE
jgi:hypothetical protein